MRVGKEGLRDRSAVDVHLLVPHPVNCDIEHDRWENGRNRGRCQQHVDNEILRFWTAARSNCPDVPDDGAP
jgi:hypothetical protein